MRTSAFLPKQRSLPRISLRHDVRSDIIGDNKVIAIKSVAKQRNEIDRHTPPERDLAGMAYDAGGGPVH
jgi:hypothetical protein